MTDDLQIEKFDAQFVGMRCWYTYVQQITLIFVNKREFYGKWNYV